MMRLGFILLSFCATLMVYTMASAQEHRPIAWDGLGQNPNQALGRSGVPKRRVESHAPAQSNPNRERERVLGTLRPYSEAWWAVHDEIEAENDRQLGSRLVICPRCIPSPASGEEATGSIR